MGFRSWLSWLGRGSRAVTEFAASTPRPIDQLFAEMRSRSSTVTREEAMTVPAVLKARNMICASATLPLNQLDPENNIVRNPLLDQIDPNVANVVTLAQTFEDLIFDAIAWWRVTARSADGFPFYAVRVDPTTVSLVPPPGTRTPAPLPSGDDPRGAVVWMDGQPVPFRDVIRFDSPNPAVRKVMAGTIRKARMLGDAANVYADNQRPQDYFSPAEGAPELSKEEIQDILDDWRNSRKRRATGFVPESLKYNTVDAPTPAELQLAELTKEATLDVANALGIDPEELGVSTTSRTYQNDVDRRRNRVNDLLQAYMLGVSQRLSMGDVTKRGYTVVFNLDDYMKSNPTERWNTYKIAKDMGALTVDEIRVKEKEPPMPTVDEAPAVQPAAPASVAASAGNVVALRMNGTTLRFADVPVAQFSVDRENRIIEGIALPYGKVGTKYGVGFRFEAGSIQFGDAERVKLFRDHDYRQAIGYALGLQDTRQGLKVRFKVARGAAGDEALSLAEDKVLDGLSVGVDFNDATDTVPDPKNKGALLVRRADLVEVSLTPMPAFADARVTKVAASLQGGNMKCATCEQEHAPNVACVPQNQPAAVGQFNQLPATVAQPPAQPATPVSPGTPAQFSMEQLLNIAQVLNGGPIPVALKPPEGPTVVDPTHSLKASTIVTEPAPYRFDRKGNLHRGTHDFSQDLFAAQHGDAAGYERALEFVRKQFDVATGDVNELNPTRQRPDMYVDQKDFTYPVWESINKGTLTDITPFTFPKFSSAAGLVGAHTEGVEPTSGTYVTTSQTVTPTANSGKAKITRETWDQGGNPQVSNLIWRQMVKGWFEGLEAAAVALLDAASPTQIDFSGTPGLADDDLDQALTAAFAALQFIRGGFRMNNGFTQIDLYKALIAAKDGQGRRLYPAIGPTNAMGTIAQRFAAVDVNGVTMLPAWALAASGAVVASSYIFDDADVHGWASAPQRLEFTTTEVAHVYIGIWGYKATAISDITGVREILYDPS